MGNPLPRTAAGFGWHLNALSSILIVAGGADTRLPYWTVFTDVAGTIVEAGDGAEALGKAVCRQPEVILTLTRRLRIDATLRGRRVVVAVAVLAGIEQNFDSSAKAGLRGRIEFDLHDAATRGASGGHDPLGRPSRRDLVTATRDARLHEIGHAIRLYHAHRAEPLIGAAVC